VRPRFSLGERIDSFRYAFRGGVALVRGEHNARIHLVATLVVVACGALGRVSAGDWALLAVAIGGVWVAEAFNTALEHLADEVSLEERPGIGRAKDVAAFGVLVSAAVAVVIGVVVFDPCLLR
jgi:diacylglycerol kinase (ATP)